MNQAIIVGKIIEVLDESVIVEVTSGSKPEWFEVFIPEENCMKEIRYFTNYCAGFKCHLSDDGEKLKLIADKVSVYSEEEENEKGNV